MTRYKYGTTHTVTSKATGSTYECSLDSDKVYVLVPWRKRWVLQTKNVFPHILTSSHLVVRKLRTA